MLFEELFTGIKRRLSIIERDLTFLEDNLKNVKRPVSCEKCGYLVSLQNAIKGKSFVKTKKFKDLLGQPYEEEYIYTPFFCKEHAPKIKGGKIK